MLNSKMSLASTSSQSDSDSFLVRQSLSQKRWQLTDTDPRMATALAQRFGLPESLSHILSARGITLENFESFTQPRLRDALPKPFTLRDSRPAAQRISQALVNQERVAIFGDYDVDGVTSTSLMVRFFRACGLPADHITPYIPDRMTEGYGPNTPALEKLAANHDLILTVDCGITAFEPLQRMAELNQDIIVIDHHGAEATLPPAIAVVNPNRLDEPADSELRHIAAVEVCFLVLIDTIKTLREQDGGWPLATPEPDLRQWLDLVALGTVCDVMPLTGLNRALVTQGVRVAGMRGNTGLGAMLDILKLTEAPKATHFGFMIGPRLNAGGRIHHASQGVELLTTADPMLARSLAVQLDALNTERQEIEKSAVSQAIDQVDTTPQPHERAVLTQSPDWHPGVIGLVASRLKERFYRPSFALAVDTETGIAKGSGRSIEGVDLGALVHNAKAMGILEGGGGHPMAAGITIKADKINAFHTFLTEQISAQLGDTPMVDTLRVDALVTPAMLTLGFYDQLTLLEPCGQGNPNPRFAMMDVRLRRIDVLKDKHLRLTLSAPSGGKQIQAMSFNSVETPMGSALLNAGADARLHAAIKLKRSQWQGRDKLDIFIDDCALA